MKLPKPDGGDFINVPDGTHPAICYRVLDLGTQSTAYMGQEKEQRKVLLSWELKDPELVIDKDGKLLPMTLHQRYTFSMFDKALLRQHLEAWRGKAFTDEDFDGPKAFAMERLLGAPCLITVVNETAKSGKTYSNVRGVAKMPKGMTVGPLINETVFLSLDPKEFRKEVLDKLPDRLKDVIADSPEYQKLAHGSGGNAYASKQMMDESDIPF